MSKKAPIDYLQFLSYPSEDIETQKWFFTYLDPKDEIIKRVANRYKTKLFNIYKKKKKEFVLLKKRKKATIQTTTIVDESKKVKSKSKNKSKENNKLIVKEIDTEALKLKIQGYSNEEIISSLVETYKISTFRARDAIVLAYKDLAKDLDEDFIRLTMFSHSQCFDDLYKKFMILDAPKLAMRSLRAKETLNGIGNDIYEIQVNNVIFDDTKELIVYGMSKLNNSEQQELTTILSRISKVNESNGSNKIT